jgi:hypothetical protein
MKMPLNEQRLHDGNLKEEEEECWKLIAITLSLEIEIRTPWWIYLFQKLCPSFPFLNHCQSLLMKTVLKQPLHMVICISALAHNFLPL